MLCSFSNTNFFIKSLPGEQCLKTVCDHFWVGSVQGHSDHFDEAVPCVIVAIGSTIPEIEQVTDPKADLRCYASRQSEITVTDE